MSQQPSTLNPYAIVFRDVSSATLVKPDRIIHSIEGTPFWVQDIIIQSADGRRMRIELFFDETASARLETAYQLTQEQEATA